MPFVSIKGFHQWRILTHLAAGILGIAWGNAAYSDWSPVRNVELISSAAPGGGPDVTARIIQSIWHSKKMIDVTMSVVNKPGGNYSAAYTYLNQHGGDPHYLLMASLGLLAGNAAGASAISLTDVAAIARLFSEYMVVAVRADSPIKTGRDLAQRLMIDPSSISIAVGGGAGGVNHLAIATAMKSAGVAIRNLKLVSFNSSAESMVAVLGRHVDAVASTATAFIHAEPGALRILAISAPRRVGGAFAGAPTWREQGIDAIFDNFRVVLGPKGIQQEQINYWEGMFSGLTASDEWKRTLAANHWTAAYLKSAETRQAMATQYEQLQSVLTELGLTKN